MPRMVINEVWDREGNLVESTEIELPDEEATPEERLAQVEATLEAIGKADSFAAAKAAISERLPVTDRETKG